MAVVCFPGKWEISECIKALAGWKANGEMLIKVMTGPLFIGVKI